MKSKFMFFGIKHNLIINILIIIEIALWIFYSASLISLINFDNSYKERFNRSLPINNTEVLKFYKFIDNGDYDENSEMYNQKIKDVLSIIKSYDYTYGFVQRDGYNKIPIETFGLTQEDLESNFSKAIDPSLSNYPVGFNYGMIKKYKNNIVGEISEEDWIKNNNFIPIIIGYDLSSKLKIGDSYCINDVTYKIIGIFKKDTLTFDYTDAVNSSFLLNNSFVIPLNEEEFLGNFGYEPITIFFNNDKEEYSSKLNSHILEICNDIAISDFHEDLDVFLRELSSQKYYEIFRVLIVTFIASASIITTINYKINDSTDIIGTLYSFGINKRNIFKIFSFEFLLNVIIAIIIGSLFYLKNCKCVYVFFINENLVLNLAISIIILIVIIISILLFGFKQVNKLSPREMIGGFTE